MEKLEPCPLCGGKTTTPFNTADPKNVYRSCWLGCEKCRLFMSFMNDTKGRREAVAKWNTKVK